MKLFAGTFWDELARGKNLIKIYYMGIYFLI